ncbi:type II toxin-antitoxin system VapC family toxin [Spirosoma sp. KUDC1026]|uniref:type II toxin-antitoxin system VapC family toxin n=1 Tax=Spirosoma sp. KUDC1026 TaxID=2745947 RepID=UPI00159B9CE3|nr:type II toxin-antitoxin system VapC family toxin [Spirosoma sp. KUDC1026]QKZ11813.1 type II toxin-antitoxin system VapC family toxin [Spirosoma sp. KUDC1026]
MIYDTNLLIGHIRERTLPPATTLIPIIVVAELEAFALKADWGLQKVEFMRYLVGRHPIVDIEPAMVNRYAEIDAFSQGKLQSVPLRTSARNMGKNDIWIAATALYLDLELYTTDNDFDHLPALGLQLVKH